MLRKIILTVGALSVSVLFSCSNGGGSVSTSEPAPVYGTAQLGNLAEASVEIYELTDNGSPVLKWTETTSSGETLDEIGKFNTHAGEMEDEKYYIIKITGGQDWDTDDNGLIDSLPTDNKGTIRLIASGKNIKSTENLKVTMISEIIYEKVAKYIKYDYSKENLAQKIDDAVEQVVEDTNGDGQVDIYDVITFDPVKHKPKLKGIYKREFVNIVSVIHSGKDAFSAVKASLNIGSLDIESYAVALSDFMTIACIASGTSGLQIVDISTPSSPTILSTLVPTTNGIYLVTLSPDGKIAYVTEGTTDKQLEIIDISNPNNPQILSSAPYDTPGSITYMKVSEINGKLYAFIADYDGGLQILNVSDPNNISTVGSLPSTDVSNTVGLTMSKNKDKLWECLLNCVNFTIA
ncbi:LVIVD repeat-containing protein [Persephonella sp.]